MWFAVVKGYASVVIRIFCRRIKVNRPEWLAANGPLLLASNHPNSFLDGIILMTMFKKNIYTLARGDAFKHPTYNRLLRWLHLLPVYRTSEGVENLEHNYTTFADCKTLFDQKEIVLIFSEGRCINEWHLRPLKKGTARLALSTWQNGRPLTVLPMGFNYNTFRNFGKNVVINFGTPLPAESIVSQPSEGLRIVAFNNALRDSLEGLVYEFKKADTAALHDYLTVPVPWWKKALLAVPAAIGWLLHAPLYYPAKAVVSKHFNNDHFDSVLTGILMLTYPLFLLLCFLFLCIFGKLWMAFSALLLLPFSAWAAVQVKPQLT